MYSELTNLLSFLKTVAKLLRLKKNLPAIEMDDTIPLEIPQAMKRKLVSYKDRYQYFWLHIILSHPFYTRMNPNQPMKS